MFVSTSVGERARKPCICVRGVDPDTPQAPFGVMQVSGESASSRCQGETQTSVFVSTSLGERARANGFGYVNRTGQKRSKACVSSCQYNRLSVRKQLLPELLLV